MPDSNHTPPLAVDLNVVPPEWPLPLEFHRFLWSFEEQIHAPKFGTEAHFLSLDVQEGDRVRLTELARLNSNGSLRPDAATLEGIVLGVKEKDGRSQLRIKGFDHTGGNAGGQHVWFPVENYRVEVLHRTYRITEDDKVLLAITGDSEHSWRSLTDVQREDKRKAMARRVAKVKRALGVDE